MNVRPRLFSDNSRITHSFRDLGADYSTEVAPQPLSQSVLADLNEQATDLLGQSEVGSLEEWRALLNGELFLDHKVPIATVYSGHQFGVWAGQLGDGRAHLLGEVNGWELQLKGSGLTPYSRQGDGKAVLRSTIREYLACEYLHALGIPSTRALGMVWSSEPVRREKLEPGAMMIRMSPSFVRFGHFEHFYTQGEPQLLRRLADYVIERFYPEVSEHNQSRYAEFFRQVTTRTAKLIAKWMVYGFCHGVMNTDNMSILGLTLDYGPYGFMEAYKPDHICNDSDHRGRYRYSNQPGIAQWNLLALAFALQDLVDRDAAEKVVTEDFVRVYEKEYWRALSARFAVPEVPEMHLLIQKLLALIEGRLDLNRFLYFLVTAQDGVDFRSRSDFLVEPKLADWLHQYYRVRDLTLQSRALLMNPRYVLKNWVAQEVIEQVERHHNFEFLKKMRLVLQDPFKMHAEFDRFAEATPDWGKCLTLSCSS